MELVVANLDDLRAQIAAGFAERAAGGRLRCAVSGGAAALIVLTALRAARIDWSGVTLILTDERADGDGSAHAALVRRALVEVVPDPKPRLCAVPAHADLDQAAAAYDAVLARELDGDAPDLAVVGLGEDGEIAGLFAGHPALDQRTRVAAVHDAPRPPRRRLTLSLGFLAGSREIWVVAIGARKRAVAQAAVTGERPDLPIARLLSRSRLVTMFTDQSLQRP